MQSFIQQNYVFSLEGSMNKGIAKSFLPLFEK